MAAFQEPPRPSITINTSFPTLPLPTLTERAPIITDRLEIRPFRRTDLAALFQLRSEPAAMLGTRLGVPDRSADDTARALDTLLDDERRFLWAAFDRATGRLLGEGGVHTLRGRVAGWPEMGFKFGPAECRGRGYGTEFVRAVLRAWWSLPRDGPQCPCPRPRPSDPSSAPSPGVEIVVHPLTVDGTKEHVVAYTTEANVASQRVLQKAGFVRWLEWTEPDTQLHRKGEPVVLVGYKLSAPE